MSTKLPGVDVLLVGFGWTGAIMAGSSPNRIEGAALEPGAPATPIPICIYAGA